MLEESYFKPFKEIAHYLTSLSRSFDMSTKDSFGSSSMRH